MKKLLFVVNPRAGTCKANKHLVDIFSVFNRAGYTVTVHVTESPGDCSQTVARLAPQMDVVVCCGGDGTFNEAINGLVRSSTNVPLGYIPAGSTNDFAASLNLPTDFPEAAKAIVEGTPHPYDVGRFHDRHFSYIASFGAFTRASYATSQNMKNLLGHAAYILSGIQEVSQIRPIHMRLELEDEVVEDDFLYGAISNATSVGGVLTLDPHQVDMADGKLELMLIRAPKDVFELTGCIHKLQNQQYDHRMITFRSFEKARITCPPDLVWTLDGERQESPECFEVSNIHHAICLLQKG